MANEYLIPVGFDTSKIFEGLTSMENGMEQLGATTKQTNAEMAAAFAKTSAAGDYLGKGLDSVTRKTLGLRDGAKVLGAELGAALSGKSISTGGLEERLLKIKKNMEGVAGKPVKFAFDFDQAKLDLFETMVKDGADELKILNQVVDMATDKLAAMDPQSEEFRELAEEVQTATDFLQQMGQASDDLNKRDQSLKSQLQGLKEELAQMEAAGQENTKEFLAMSIAAGQLEDQIGNISARVRVLASDTKYIDAGIQAVTGLAGAFAAAQGAAALFGSENEAVNEIIQKTTGAMAILQGIQAVSAAMNKDSALSVLFFSRAQTQATASTIAKTTATVAETGATVAATAATRGFTAALLANPITLVVVALVAVVAALLAFTSGSSEADKAAAQLNKTIERQNFLLKLDEDAINRRTNLLVARAKLEGKAESDLTAIQGKAAQERLALREADLAETRRLLNDRNYIAKLSAEDYKKLQDREVDQESETANLRNEIQVKYYEFQDQRNKEAKAKREKSIEDEKKDAEKQKAIVEQQIKFRREFTSAYIDSITDQYDREREQVKANLGQKIEDLRREKSLTERAEMEKNDAIILLQQNLFKQLKDIDRRRETERAALLFEGQQKLAELQAEGTAKEIEILQLSYKQREREINEQFKNEGDLRKKLLEALAAQRLRDEKRINDEAARTALNEQEQRAVLEIETAAQFLGDLPKLEEQKQVEILKVKLEYAEKNMQLLLDQGNAENSVAVLQAKKAAQEIRKALGIAQKELEGEESGFSLFKLLGLDDLSEEEKQAVEEAGRVALDSVREITGFIIDQYQRQIDAKQEQIDQETEDINRLEDQLQDEKDLREEGLANNVDAIESELDAKKRQREEDLKQQQEILKKQQAMQRLQLVIDTATQASSLVTSAANIFKSLSAIPFVGVPLAIAAIGLMVGAFVTAKVRAFQAVNEGNKQSFGGGGWIDGKKHSQGGKKYYAADGSVRELEAGEHVTRADQAEKYADLLEAINNGDLSRMKEEALRDMLGEMGIHFSDEQPREAVTIVRERDELRTEVQPGPDISDDVKEINKGVSYLADREKNRVERWEEDGYLYKRQGNTTTKKKINR